MIQKLDFSYESSDLPTSQVINDSSDEKKREGSNTPSGEQSFMENNEEQLPHPADVKRAFWLSTIIILVIAVLVPIPLGVSTYIFSPQFFTAWMVIAMVSLVLSPSGY